VLFRSAFGRMREGVLRGNRVAFHALRVEVIDTQKQ
jgi:hypothetical protein